ncbi:hypothetical protein [Bradyrhizobium sp.]|uniref:hypothetical protein n=1 Tax=Bradyrhizobium sp. TaxID=376 RepID=UPI0025BAC42E|nr:hypothetical protein [Bradyrhizobium sp.]
MGGAANLAKQDFDRILPADTGVPDGHEIVAHRMITEIDEAAQLRIAAHFASCRFAQARHLHALVSLQLR